MGLTDRQERFCKEYLIDGNASAAYVRAGYSAKGANKLSSRMMANDGIRARIDELMAEKDAALIASADEVLKYLTGVLRGEIGEEAVEFNEEEQQFERVKIPAKISDRNKAAELLGKRYGIYTDKMDVSVEVPVIVDDVPE